MIIIKIKTQELTLYDSNSLKEKFSISTSRYGVGNIAGSQCTPLGKHIIRAKIGTNCSINTVFMNRRATGLIFSSNLRESLPNKTWILTRILWLSGLERAKNRLGNVDTMRRYIYIHGAPDDILFGVPSTHGCISMRNKDVLKLFDLVSVGTNVIIEE